MNAFQIKKKQISYEEINYEIRSNEIIAGTTNNLAQKNTDISTYLIFICKFFFRFHL